MTADAPTTFCALVVLSLVFTLAAVPLFLLRRPSPR
jgi:hypothetical protein